jgi:hypothetical protein
MPIKCFLLEPAGKLARSLRRYSGEAARGQCPLMPGEYGYHNASVPFDVIDDATPTGNYSAHPEDKPAHDDPRWPQACACGYAFTGADEFQLSVDRLYRRADTGAETTLRGATPGAIWNADWLADHAGFRGPDGRSLVAKLPNGHDWMIDGEANNCTDPEGARRGAHKCWVRHGTPPDITVDKNGVTCNAGAGSILSGNYHGFLRNGEFTDC